jgi:hypothetical protein
MLIITGTILPVDGYSGRVIRPRSCRATVSPDRESFGCHRRRLSRAELRVFHQRDHQSGTCRYGLSQSNPGRPRTFSSRQIRVIAPVRSVRLSCARTPGSFSLTFAGEFRSVLDYSSRVKTPPYSVCLELHANAYVSEAKFNLGMEADHPKIAVAHTRGMSRSS